MKVIKVCRIVKARYSADAFSGAGTKLFGGRWNSPGRACVYTACSESLAIIEVMANAGRKLAADEYCLFELQLPEEDVFYQKRKKLPKNWRENPSPPETAQIGDKWLESGKSVALSVPSAVVPRERIYILNTKHKGFDRIVKKARPLPFQFDVRLG